MKLFTKEIDKKLFAQYPMGSDLENQVVVAKIFNPYGRGNWYLLNSDESDPDYIWAIVDLFEVEMGSVSRSELEGIKVPPFNLGLERDLYFEPVNAAQLYKGLLEGKQYKAGGSVQSGVNVTNELRGEDNDDYGTFELYKNGGEVDVKIINSDESFDKSRYEWLIGDYDKDGVNNVDDKKPFTQSNRQTIDSPSISNGINKLLSMKHAMDENMYEFVDELKNISPDKSKIYARTKTPYSILDKLIKKRLSTLTDLIGTTIVTQDKKELDEVKKKIESGKLGKVLELEDMYQNPKQGYRAYHFLIEKNGMPIELQLKTKRQKALNELSHEPYKLGKLDSYKLIKMTEVANKADNGDQAAIKEYNDFMQQPDLETSFYKYANGGYMQKGGEANTSLVIIDKLLSERGKLESKLFDAKVKENERWNNLGWGSGMRLSKINVSYKRTDAIKEKMKAIDEELKLMGYDKLPVGRFEHGGSVGKGNQEMLRSNVKAIGHHAKEIGSTGGKKEVEAWVVAKSERAATDLSDITHYLDGKQYAKGGKVEYVANDPYDQKYFRRFNDAIGSFGWMYGKNYNEGILYPLDSFDKEYHIELKKDEVLLRYRTDRMVKEAKYLIKINLDKALIYFMSDTDSDDDKNPKFETRGIKAEYIVISKDYAPKIMAAGGVMMASQRLKARMKKGK